MPPRRELRTFIPSNTKVNKRGCWVWKGSLSQGYGRIGIGYKVYLAHRISYELYVGPIPKGLDIDHLCRNRACVNPNHLETVTRSENLRRGIPHAGMRQRAKKFCINGHPYNKANTSIYKNGWRDCKTCRKATKQRYMERHGL